MRQTVALLMVAVLAMWAVPVGAQESAAPEENFTSGPMLCTPVLAGILVGGIVTSDVIILNNPSATAAAVTVTWFAADGTNNSTAFAMPARTFRLTTPSDVGFTANGVYSMRVQAGGNLAILASGQRIQGGTLAGVYACYFLA